MVSPLTFISPALIERIENGSFVPARRSKPEASFSERRNVLSPLAVTKRCIRYEPKVFQHRKPFILKIARSLNAPATKIVLVGGAQGSGKTSLVRGLIEVMGSHQEQLLWFDVNRHTDFEEIIQFLIQYITYVCANLGEAGAEHRAAPTSGNPQEDLLKRLEHLIAQVAHIPLLLVLDNVEYIVDPELRFNSYPFKEMLNFLLAFPNIKMVLIGERLPYADMSPNQEGVADIRLEGLPEEDAIALLERLSQAENQPPDPGILENMAAPQAEQAALRQLWRKTDGQPWLLKIAYYLHHQAHLNFQTLNRLLENPAGGESDTAHTLTTLAGLIYQRLPDQHRRLFQILSFIRHPVDTPTLLALTGMCFPVLGPSGLDLPALQDMLEHSLLKGLLKVKYPPQEVLDHIRNSGDPEQGSTPANPQARSFKPWYELYHAMKRILYTSLPSEERERVHGILQDFYMREKGLEADTRVLKIKNRAIMAEAKYHGSASRERKPASGAMLLNNPDGHTLASKAYLSGFGKPVSGSAPLTLEDYKNIQLPEAMPIESVSAEVVAEQPSFMSLLQGGNGHRSMQAQLAELELTEEEKQLLSHQQSLGERLDLENQKRQASKEAPAQPAEQSVLQTEKPMSAAVDVLSASQLAKAQDAQEKTIQNRLTAAVAAQNHALIAQELVELARYRASHGRYESAGHCLQKALSLKSEASKEVVAEIYRLNGSVNKKTFHHNAALSSLAKAAEVIRKLMYEDDTVGAVWLDRLGQVYQDLGEIHAYRKQYPDATEAFQQSLRWYHSSDNVTRQAEVHFQLATAYDDQQQATEAIEHYQKALSLDEAQGNQQSAAASLCNLAGLYQEQGQVQKAAACFLRALRHDQASQNKEGQWNTLEALASLHIQQKNWEQAENVTRQGLGLAVHESAPLWQASFYMKLGQIYEARQQWPLACKQFQLAQSSGAQVLSTESLRWIETKIQETQRRAAQEPR
ncbi:tetratricopeptide repeat protein [Vampirovibrio sp.]|uniref:tetratricopeptide repeat protein n=1 Tax=Vampirovibrio sp. TaxID=2717857 RepID=UPI00359441B0